MNVAERSKSLGYIIALPHFRDKIIMIILGDNVSLRV